MANMISVKTGKDFVVYDNGMVMLKNVRLSYPHLDLPFKSKKNTDPDSVGKYSLIALLPKKTHEAVKNVCESVIDGILKSNKVERLSSEKKFLRDGDESDNVEYAGYWTVSASETIFQPVRNKRGALILDKTEIKELFYGGCWGNVLIQPWWQDNDYGRRVNAKLRGVQFVKDDDPFGGGRIDSSDAWGAVEDDDDLDEDLL